MDRNNEEGRRYRAEAYSNCPLDMNNNEPLAQINARKAKQSFRAGVSGSSVTCFSQTMINATLTIVGFICDNNENDGNISACLANVALVQLLPQLSST